MAQRLQNRDRDRLLSTGKAAEKLSVTPDAVLKWIKSGRLPALRTAGGHYRIAQSDLDGLVGGGLGPPAKEGRGFVYCWEYYGTGGTTSDDCLECLVYRARAHRCYEISALASEVGYSGAHCTTTCEECAYFNDVVLRPRRVIVVTESEGLMKRLRRDRSRTRLEIEFARSEYECSAICEDFRPEVVVLDGALEERVRASLCSHLAADSRVPGVQIIVAVPGNGAEAADPTDVDLNRALPRMFSLSDLEEYIMGLEVTPVATA